MHTQNVASEEAKQSNLLTITVSATGMRNIFSYKHFTQHSLFLPALSTRNLIYSRTHLQQERVTDGLEMTFIFFSSYLS